MKIEDRYNGLSDLVVVDENSDRYSITMMRREIDAAVKWQTFAFVSDEMKTSEIDVSSDFDINKDYESIVRQFNEINYPEDVSQKEEEVALDIEIRDKTIAFFHSGGGTKLEEFSCIEPEDKERILDWVKEGHGEDSAEFSDTYDMINSEEAEHLFIGKEQMLYDDISKVLANDEFREKLREDKFEMSDLSEEDFAEHVRDMVADEVDEVSITIGESEGYAMHIASDALAKKVAGEELSADEDYILSGGVQSLVGSSEFDKIIGSEEFDNLVEAKVAEQYPEHVNGFITHENFAQVVDACKTLDNLRLEGVIDVNDMTLEKAELFVQDELADIYIGDQEDPSQEMDATVEVINDHSADIARFYRSHDEIGAVYTAKEVGSMRENDVKVAAADYKEALREFEHLHADGQEVPAELSERLNESGNYLLEEGGQLGQERFDAAHRDVDYEMEKQKEEDEVYKAQSDGYSQSM